MLKAIRQFFYYTPVELYENGQKWARESIEKAGDNKDELDYYYTQCCNPWNSSENEFDYGAMKVFHEFYSQNPHMVVDY